MDWKVKSPPTVEPLSLTEAKLHLRVDHTNDDALIPTLIKVAREWCEGFQNRAFVQQTIEAKRDNFETTMLLPIPPLKEVSSIQYVDANGDTQTLGTSVYDVDTISEPGLITLAYNQSWPVYRSIHHAITITYKTGYILTFTEAVDTDTITAAGHTYSDTDIVRLSNYDGALPTGLSANTDYYVRDVSGDTLKLAATSGGDAISLTAASTGTNFIGEVPESVTAAMKLLIGHLYEHREMVSEITLQEVPIAVRSLLSFDRIMPI